MFDPMEFVTVDEARTASAQDTDFQATWYEVDSSTAYPAMIDYLAEHQDEVIQLALTPDSALFGRALNGDWLAGLIVRCRQIGFVVNGVPADAWALALQARTEFPAGRRGAEVQARAVALTAARLFFTEALHQSIENAPMGVHWLRDERFRQDAEGF